MLLKKYTFYSIVAGNKPMSYLHICEQQSEVSLWENSKLSCDKWYLELVNTEEPMVRSRQESARVHLFPT